MKIGDRFVCIDNRSYAADANNVANNVKLTIGKVYIVNNITRIEDQMYLIFVIDDDGRKDFFSKKRFVPLSELRKDKLLKLNKV